MQGTLYTEGHWLVTSGQLRISLAVSDAWFYQFLASIQRPTQWERNELTLGSVQYLVTAEAAPSASTWRYTFRQLTALTTYYDVATNGGRPSLNEARELFAAFSQWHTQATGGELGEAPAETQNRAEDVDIPKPPARTVADPDAVSHNAWAYQQLAAGRPRAAVFQEWMTRRKIYPSSPEEMQRARETFTKAMSRRRVRQKP
jgi:hypothetical protein